MKKPYNFCIVIARCQPPHFGHIKLFKKALELGDEVIIVLGSNRSAPSIRNPWSFSDREQMIKLSLEKNTDISKFHFVAVRDHHYNDINWISEVQQKVMKIVKDKDKKISLIGHKKDSTSYYLDLFPQWDFIEVGEIEEKLNATEIRNIYFNKSKNNNEIKKLTTEEIFQFLENYSTKPEYKNMCDNFEYITNYQNQWSSAPYPPTFLTADCVVVKAGHVLLIKRKLNPGKGYWALPGGFVGQEEKIEDAALRELKEETKIEVHKNELRKNIKSSHVFDHPLRSARKRTITVAFYIKLFDDSELPSVKGSDDAETAEWVPLGDLGLMEDKFFEDHLQIINYFTNQ